MQLCRFDGALAAEVDVNAAALLMGSEREFHTQLPDLFLIKYIFKILEDGGLPIEHSSSGYLLWTLSRP